MALRQKAPARAVCALGFVALPGWINCQAPGSGCSTVVYLSRIYTKAGDGGETGLGDGTRVAKDHPRVAAVGEVDELNAVLGMLVAVCPDFPELPLVRSTQNDLFDVGGDLCVPVADGEEPGKCLRITAVQVERLEKAIDRLNEPLS